MTAISQRVLFLPQNDSHAETTALLEPFLAERGMGSAVLDMDGVFHQGTARYLRDIAVLPSGLSSPRPFYRLAPHRQLRIVAGARPHVPGWLSGFDAVVAFNDGALQRLVLTNARHRGITTHIVLDGIFGSGDPPRSVRSTLRHLLRTVGRRLGDRALGAFFPSELGQTAVDQVFVAGRHSAEVLHAQGSSARRIIPTGLPRWPDPEWDHPPCVRRVLYLTGAFRWHNDPETAIAQLADVQELAAVCAQLGLELVIRMHPRDDPRDYDEMAAQLVDARSEPLVVTIRATDLTLSIVSTGLFDSIILGRPTRVLAIHPRWDKYRGHFISDPIFKAIRDPGGLHAVLNEFAARVDPAELDDQRAGVEPYVASTGVEAARRIAAWIATPGQEASPQS